MKINDRKQVVLTEEEADSLNGRFIYGNHTFNSETNKLGEIFISNMQVELCDFDLNTDLIWLTKKTISDYDLIEYDIDGNRTN